VSEAEYPGICPILSSAAYRDRKGNLVPAAEAPCLGESCQMFRPEDGRCSLFTVPYAVDGALEAQDRAGRLFEDLGTSAERKLEAAVRQLQETAARMQAAIETAASHVAQGADPVQKSAKQLARLVKESVSGNEKVLVALQEEVRRLEEEEREATAERAAAEARRFYEAGNAKDASFHLEMAARSGLVTPALLNLKGCVHLRTGDLTGAERAFRRCLESDPGYGAAWINLGHLHLRRGLPEEAEEALRKGLTLDPGSAAGVNSLGNVFFLTGRRREAVEEWRKAVEIDPGLEAAWENLRRQQLLDHRPFEELAGAARPPEDRTQEVGGA